LQAQQFDNSNKLTAVMLVYNAFSIQAGNTVDWIGLSSVLRPRQHSIGYLGDGFTGHKTQPTVSKY